MGKLFVVAAVCMMASIQPSSAQFVNPRDAMRAAIDCSQWTKNADGTWDTGPHASLPGMKISNSKHVEISNTFLEGVNVGELLAEKCGK